MTKPANTESSSSSLPPEGVSLEQIAERIHEEYCDEPECFRMGHACGMESHILSALRAVQAQGSAEREHERPDYKPAWDEINCVFDEARVLLASQPKSYLGWNWVHALVDALKRREAQFATAKSQGRAEGLWEAADRAVLTAATIRKMTQAFVAGSVQSELAIVRAEALEEYAKNLQARATEAERPREEQE